MKRTIFALLLACGAVSCLFAQGKKDSNYDSELMIKEAAKETITGVIAMYGNMPFAIPGLKTSDGKYYTLVSDEKMMKKLKENAGRRVSIKGVINYPLEKDEMVFQLMENGYVYVDSFEIVKPKKKNEK